MPANPSDSILKKLLHRPSCVVALSIIGFTCVVAVFAYILAPDNTPYANRMIVELGARQPGFTKQLLLLPKIHRQERRTPVFEWFNGTPSDFQ
jgi:hypothetical protein